MKRVILIYAALFAGMLTAIAQDSWVLEADNIDPANYYGISVSNGMIGVISDPAPLMVKEVILAGVYDCYGRGRTTNFLPSFNLLDLKLTIAGHTVAANNISNFRQYLDMRTGKFTGSFDLKDIASVEYTYYALRHLPHNVMMDVNVTPFEDTSLDVVNILKTPSSLRDNQMYFNEINPSHAYIPLLTSTAMSPSGNIKIVASNTFIFPFDQDQYPSILHEIRDNDSHLMRFSTKICKGQPYTFSLVGSLISSEHVNDPYNQTERMSIYANLQGHDNLRARHDAEWDNLWKADITIEGDPQAQQDVHNMMYHLYSFTRNDSGYSLSPMGLSGLGYNGHVFWDTEIFMYLPLLVLHPELAKGFVEYRYNRLDAANKNALLHGYKGAMYPWESATSGEEETPVWALTGTYEHHITADVAFAAWYYYIVTQDKEWLKDRGWPILKNTADFWVSRVQQNNGKYEIKNVVCADEWAENVDNNAYTNAIAKLNLQFATEGAKVLGQSVPSEWIDIANNLVFAKMDNGVTREHDSYTGQNIKQADVNLLAYPLKVITDKNQIKLDLEYYEAKVPEKETPAMTQSIFSLLYSRLGDAENANKWFDDSYKPNLLPPFRVLAETKGGTNPYFITGAGGILQAVMMGFGGVDIQPNGNVNQIKTAMPSHWTKLTITNVGKAKETVMVVKD